jgi:CHAT domain-containing protein/pimeloyl-ACP methyl ester carboxylesterase
MPTMKIAGETTGLTPSELTGVRLDGKLKVTERAAVRVEKARAAEGKLVSLNVADDDVIEVELDGGVKLWTTVAKFQGDFGMSPRRDAGSEYLSFPTEIEIGGPSRGLVGWAIKAVRIFDVDLPGMTVAGLARAWEEKHIPSPGLYRCLQPTPVKLEPMTAPLPSDIPVLVFLHGTASSFEGSFGALWDGPQSKIGTTLFNAYHGHVYAFQHRTFTESPIENAIALLKQLPDNARLHLVSHSRGGLIGELLCRAAVTTGRDPFDEKDVALFADTEDEDGAKVKRARDRAALATLNDLLKKKRPRIERFVRVACPVRGSTLASERLDRWLSVIINTLSFCGLQGSLFFEAATDLITAMIKEHTDPRTLPGLEAMMPTSPLVKSLNRFDVTVNADLSVISGDTEAGGIWDKLKLLALDRFYEDDHDLAVNSSSMIGGARRTAGGRFFFDQGEQVNHFHYFVNDRTAEKIRDGLLWRDTSPVGFAPIEDRPRPPIARAARGGARPAGSRPAGPRPVVFVLPGIMGSHLKRGESRVWLNLPNLLFGGLEALHIGADGVTPDGPLEGYYEDVIEFLGRTHEVVPFAFDWRLSLRDEARRLADQVRAKLDEAERAQQPVRLFAHSMGGLVVRIMIGDHPEVWTRLCRHPGGRFIMLGTPNSGSFSIPRSLFGQDKLLKQLALLDLTNSPKELLKTISKFPGMLEMLPAAGNGFDFFKIDTWRQFAQADDKGWVLPDEARLQAALATRSLLDQSPIDPQRMLYVAGHAPKTPAALEVEASADRGERLRFISTARGDGRVPWETGIPPGVRVWYADCEHGDLAAYEAAFPALLELLQTGHTTRLPQTAPAVTRGTERIVLSRDVADAYPDEKELAAAAVGTRRRQRRVEPKQRIKVSIVHGHLGFTAHAVMVGHYQGDTVVSAEAELDRMLDGRLRERLRLGLYPGALDSADVFLNPGKKPGGAIVIGLGRVGELTPGYLTASVTRGALLYAAALAEQARSSRGDRQTGPVRAAMTTLLIGTGAGGMSVEDSLSAILRGVARANRTLTESGPGKRVIFTAVDVLELWEDRAVLAAHALPRLTEDPLLRGVFEIEPTIRQTSGWRKRVTFEEPGGWYQRLQITAQADGALRFQALTNRARAEVSLQPTQRALVDQFIARAIADPSNDQQTTRTLFELLMPNLLKEQAANRQALVLVVNDNAARYPWEMMQDRRDSEGLPLAVRAGFIRQLETEEFRANPLGVTQLKALVIGDPVSQFIELKGAQEEAERVAAVLERQGFAVKKKIRTHAQEIVEALFDDDYRILHLAGHGVYQYPLDEHEPKSDEPPPQSRPNEERPRAKKTVSGMVIGTQVFLTPTEVEQMRQVPELVFINCCHLGKVEGGKDTDRKDRHTLAANLAAQFIRMGVRAVIAAGWAVDDAAAHTFACEFYARLLAGAPFGNAVLQARKKTYESHGAVNTWGAYQCYGDPDWRLRSEHGMPAGRQEESPFVTPGELVLALDNLTNEAKNANSQRIEVLRAEMTKLASTLTPDWLARADVRIALGQAYGELDLFAEAITHYQHAVASESGEGSFHTIEQFANLQCRAAVAAVRDGTGNRKEAKRLIGQAIASLECLRALSNAMRADAQAKKPVSASDTIERLALFGSAYKRLAFVTTGRERGRALQEMASYYDAAYTRAAEQGRVDTYPILNLIPAQMLLRALFPRLVKGTNATSDLLQKVTDAIQEHSEAERDFWGVVTAADCLLTRHLVEGTLPDNIGPVVQEYLTAKRRAGSPREFRSVVEHLDFLIEMWREDTKNRAGKKRLTALQDIREKLTQID